jgi:hypothetical protein
MLSGVAWGGTCMHTARMRLINADQPALDLSVDAQFVLCSTQVGWHLQYSLIHECMLAQTVAPAA